MVLVNHSAVFLLYFFGELFLTWKNVGDFILLVDFVTILSLKMTQKQGRRKKICCYRSRKCEEKKTR